MSSFVYISCDGNRSCSTAYMSITDAPKVSVSSAAANGGGDRLSRASLWFHSISEVWVNCSLSYECSFLDVHATKVLRFELTSGASYSSMHSMCPYMCACVCGLTHALCLPVCLGSLTLVESIEVDLICSEYRSCQEWTVVAVSVDLLTLLCLEQYACRYLNLFVSADSGDVEWQCTAYRACYRS